MVYLIGMQGIVEGGKIEGGPIICDVRDVAAAHILAAETPSASGRQARVPHRFLLLTYNPPKAVFVAFIGPFARSAL